MQESPARGRCQDAGNEGRVRYSAAARRVDRVGNSKIEIGKSRGSEPPPPRCFVSAHSKGVTASICVTAHSKGVAGGQLRPKPGKTRCLLVTAHSKGLSARNRGTAHSKGLILRDRKSTRLNSSHSQISYAVFCLKKKNK